MLNFLGIMVKNFVKNDKFPSKLQRFPSKSKISSEWHSQIPHFFHACLHDFKRRIVYFIIPERVVREIVIESISRPTRSLQNDIPPLVTGGEGGLGRVYP